MKSGAWGCAMWVSVAALMGCGPRFIGPSERGESGAGDAAGAGGSGGGPHVGPLSTHPVTVADSKGALVVGAKLVVSDADGTLAAVQETDAAGAVVEVPAGGSVAAFWTEGEHRFIAAVYEPPAGASVRLESRVALPPPPDTGNTIQPTFFSVDATGVLPSGIQRFWFASTCESGGPENYDGGIIEFWNEGCETEDTIDAILLFGKSGLPAYWGTVADLIPAPGGLVEKTLQQISADFALTEQTVHGIPAGSAVTTSTRTTKESVLLEFPAIDVFDDGEAFVARSGAPLIPGATFETLEQVVWGDETEVWAMERVWRATGEAPSDSLLDVAAQPRLWGLAMDGTVAGRPRLEWSGAEGAVEADCAAAGWTWATHAGIVQFSAVLPMGRAALQVADIPDELSEYRPAADAAYVRGRVELITSPATPGLAACVDGSVRPRDPAATPGEHFVSRVERAVF